MGRVARYKKVKSFDKRKAGEPDPLFDARRSKKRRNGNKRKQEFDLPPKPDHEEEGGMNKQQNPSSSTIRNGKLDFQILDLKEEARLARFAREDSRSLLAKQKKNNSNNPHGKVIIQGKKEGESMRSFHKRVKEETGEILRREVNAEKVHSARQAKRKQFCKNKKLKKKGKVAATSDVYGYNSDDNDAKKYSLNDNVMFGEQAERPPEFRHLPRGAKKRRTGAATTKDAQDGASLIHQEKQAAEQRNLEIMRQKVQAQYALLKAKRKNGGV
eukprot:CAMPEP_0116035162 /NCGR_PEP_ID=MMETSP0321-20121206/20134_1 /TAXON_ID=163516 /ORGANISM="Leptocylindrus danicus var. danicus, Strain B650" /LENGTH=270 /DNA_ID=CAMNT_0003511803 /DNA_START=111 /DNA_END=923 /DNA_ORIENTATION=+